MLLKKCFKGTFCRKTDEELYNLTQNNKNEAKKTYEKILRFCTEERTAKEIAKHCGYKSVDRFKRNYLKQLVDSGEIKMTIPDKSKSKKRRCISK